MVPIWFRPATKGVEPGGEEKMSEMVAMTSSVLDIAPWRYAVKDLVIGALTHSLESGSKVLGSAIYSMNHPAVSEHQSPLPASELI